MNDDQFQNPINICFEELENKQQALVDDFGFGSFDKYEYSFDKEELHFINDDRVEVVAKIVPIGSFYSDSNTWMWAWANEAFTVARQTIQSIFTQWRMFSVSAHKRARHNRPLGWTSLTLRLC